MKVEFMVEYGEFYNSDMNYKIVESGNDYDIYRVETDDISKIHVISKNGSEYVAEQTMKFKNGKETMYYVSIWGLVE